MHFSLLESAGRLQTLPEGTDYAFFTSWLRGNRLHATVYVRRDRL
jgi:hypothetical protein